MRRFLFLAATLLFFGSPAFAQFTTVTATVKDPDGIPYAGAVMNAILVPSTGGGYTLGGQPYSGRIGPVTLDASGSFTVNFGDVTLITPGSPQWQITVSSAAATIALPLGTGPQSFTYTSSGTTISGSSPVSLSTALNALAPALTNITIGSGSVTSVAATSPIVVTPSPIISTGTVSCATCVVASSPSVGLAHFAGSTQTVTSSAVNLAGADVTGQLPIGSVGSAGLSGTSPITISAAGAIACATCSTTSSTVPINQVVSPTGAISTIALGNNNLPFTCGLTTTQNCITLFESSPAPASDVNARLLLIETAAGSNSQSLVIFPLGAGPAGANAPFSFFVGGQPGGAASASSNGFMGSPIQMQVGDGSAGGATTGTGGTGGSWNLGGGNGGAAGGTSSNAGGAGGQDIWNLGNGGNGNTTGNGGAAGTWALNPGAGTGGNGGATSGTGGAGADISLASGTGGNAAVGSTTGRGGNITLTLGRAGSTGTPGVPGKTLISRSTGPQGNTTTPLLDVVDTWNTSGVVDALIRGNVTADTAHGAGSLLFDLQDVGASKFKVDITGLTTAQELQTLTNCSSSASPAVCGSASAGSVVIAAAGTTVTVNTTAVTANSQIFLAADDTLGTKLSVTCNSTLATLIGGLAITARTGGTSFQITSGATPAVNPLCLSYFIVN